MRTRCALVADVSPRSDPGDEVENPGPLLLSHGFSRLLAPVMGSGVRRANRKDLALLRRIFEL